MHRAAMKALGRFLAGLIVCAAIAIPEPALAAIARVGTQSASSGTGSSTSLTVPIPAGTAAGDVMVTVVGVRNATQRTITPPASGGWVRVLSHFSAAADYTQEVWFKVAGLAEPANYTWSWGSNDRSLVATVSYRGVDTVVPINASGGQTNAAAPVIAPSINTTLGGTVLVGF